MRNFGLLSVLVSLLAILPLGLFLFLSNSILKNSLKSSVVNEPEAALSQSLNGLNGTFGQAVNRNLLTALKFSQREDLRKALSTPTPSTKTISELGKAEAKQADFSFLVIADKKGDVYFNTLNLPLPSPSPTATAKSKKSKPKSKSSPRPTVKDWPGMDRALGGLNASGVFPFNGTSYLVSIAPVQNKGKTTGVVLAGAPIDESFLNGLKTGAVNEVAFYSAAQTLCTKTGPPPPLDYETLTATTRPQIQWQHSSYLAGAIPLFGLDTQTMGYLVTFQPVKQTMTVAGSPQRQLVKTGLLWMLVVVTVALLFLWRFSAAFNQLVEAVEQIKGGNLDAALPTSRPDELGRMARSLREMTESLREKDRISLVLGKVVDPEAARKILSNKDYFSLKGERRECTLLQADLKGFNTLSENMPPEALVEALNRYFSIINEAVFKYEGMLDKFIGDTAIAVWGAPFPHVDKEERAVNAALEIQEALKEFNISRIKTGHPPFTVGIGIHTGVVVSGNLGSDKHYDYSIIGEPLHVAAKLCSMAAPGQTVVSGETYGKINNLVKARPLNPIAVKGALEPLPTFEVSQLL